MKTLALVFTLFASTASIQFDTSKLPVGGVDAKFAGSRRVTVERTATATIVRVEEGERVDTLTMVRENDQVEKIITANNGKVRPFIAMERPKVIVDGLDLEPYLNGAAGVPSETIQRLPSKKRTDRYERSPMAQREYVCPKDGAVLRVPTNAKATAFACPLDGTPMEAGIGPNQKYWRVE
ncbi:MAG TPA: hypothetical protein VF883_18325 [Thermoanaerobaculia bacterium]|jgi:hypothetical protein